MCNSASHDVKGVNDFFFFTLSCICSIIQEIEVVFFFFLDLSVHFGLKHLNVIQAFSVREICWQQKSTLLRG